MKKLKNEFLVFEFKFFLQQSTIYMKHICRILCFVQVLIQILTRYVFILQVPFSETVFSGCCSLILPSASFKNKVLCRDEVKDAAWSEHSKQSLNPKLRNKTLHQSVRLNFLCDRSHFWTKISPESLSSNC